MYNGEIKRKLMKRSHFIQKNRTLMIVGCGRPSTILMQKRVAEPEKTLPSGSMPETTALSCLCENIIEVLYASVPNASICVNAGKGEPSSALISLFSCKPVMVFGSKVNFWGSALFSSGSVMKVPSLNVTVPSVQ